MRRVWGETDGRRLQGISTFIIIAAGAPLASACASGPAEPSPQALCLPGSPAPIAAFNDRPHLEQDDAGNILLWWWASSDRPLEEGGPDARIQMAAWEGSRFSPARQPDAAEQIALRGAGRWLALRSPEDEIELDTWSPDCSRVTTALAPHTAPDMAPSLMTNARGDLVLAWTGVVSDTSSQDELVDFGLFVARSPSGGALPPPQLIFQVQNESIPAHLAIDAAGGASVAYPRVELVTPELGFYRTEVVDSSDDFGTPAILPAGLPFAFASDAAGAHLLAIQASDAPATALHLQRSDGARGWTALPDYVCQRPGCDVQFGLLRDGAVLIVERTFMNLHAVLMDAAGARDALTFPQFEVGAAILSHALSVGADGTARSIWLTEKAIQTATFSLGSGWSAPEVLLARAIAKEDGWLGNESGSVATQYPMRIVRLDDGRLLAVWSELGGLVRVARGDTAPLEATEQTLWSLVTDGMTATLEPLVPEP